MSIREDGRIVGGLVLKTGEENDYEGEAFDGMFRFEKRMKS